MKAAASYNVTLLAREGNMSVSVVRCISARVSPPHRLVRSVTISVRGELERYDIEHELEFTSDRKRMSVIVRNLATDR